MRNMNKDCHHKKDCSFTNRQLDWCNIIPIWYQTTDETLIAPTLKCLKEKMARRKHTGQIEKCTLIIPVKHGQEDGCKYSTEIVNNP